MDRKLLFLFFFATTFSGKLSGQVYFSFLDSNSVWRDTKLTYCSHGPSYMSSKRLESNEYLHGDTVIGHLYKKVYSTGVEYSYTYDHGLVSRDTVYYCREYKGGLREDSAHRVFFISSSGMERLLFDFNLGTGDSVFISAGPWNYYVYVQSIDSIFICDRYRKRFNLSGSTPLIEGIGLQYGLLGTAYEPVCGWDRLRGYFYKGSFCHGMDSDATLFECAASVETGCEEAWTLFPNPALESAFIIRFNHPPMDNRLEIFSAMGSLVYSSSLPGMENILEPGLPSGIYILRVTENGMECERQLVVQK